MKKRLIALLCVAAMLLSVMAVTVSATTWLPDTADEGSDKIGITHKTGTDLENWKATNFESKTSKTDQEYSFVFVGDTQFLTYADARDNTKNVQAIYKWIADNKSNKKIAHVFALGDMTHFSYGNDETLINDRAYNLGFGTGTAEWNVVKAATDQLKDAGISYSVVRGNHDDYTIDTIYGGDSTYTSQFNDFYRPNSGRYMSNSITNSWRTLDIHGDKYLFLTIDFNPTMAVLDWANEVIANNPDRKVIITTHSYLSPDGTHQKAESDYDSYKGGLEAITESTVDGEMMWDKLVRKYENIIMVVGGHVSTGDKGEDTSEHNVTYTYRTGDNGNKVTEMIINPQVLDQLQTYTGLVCVMNFYDNGERVELEYYSPLLNSYKKLNSDVIRFDDEPTRDVGTIDMISVADECGNDVLYIDSPITAAPTLNGSIASNEYSVTRTITNSNVCDITPDDGVNDVLEGDLTEYMAYDDDYIYYAFSVEQSTPKTVMLQLMPRTRYNTASEFSTTHYDRPTLARIGYGYDDSQGENVFQKLSMACWTSSDTSMAVWDEDVFMNASYNTTSKITTYEIKISRQYLKNNNYDDTEFGYMLFVGNAQYCWVNPSILGTSRTWSYNFVTIVSPINTLEKASIRISTTQNGLRFKSIVNKNALNQLQDKYPDATISVGTLISSADLLGSTKLTHSVDVAFIDIPATLDMPFAEDATTKTYAGSITDIKDKNLDRDFVGVGYIKVERTGQIPIYYYSDTQCTRNVSYVASMAYADVQETQTSGYEYKISSNDGFGDMYSPYSMPQRNIIKSLIKYKGIKDPFDYDIF